MIESYFFLVLIFLLTYKLLTLPNLKYWYLSPTINDLQSCAKYVENLLGFAKISKNSEKIQDRILAFFFKLS